MRSFLEESVTGWLDDPRAGFAVGTFGAVAEFLHPPGGRVTVDHDRGVHTAICVDGALRIDLRGPLAAQLSAHAWRRPTGSEDWTEAVALCLPIDVAAGPGRARVTVLGADPDPLGPPGTLVDLGLGVAHLEACIRTTDDALLARCEAAELLDGPLVHAIFHSRAARVFRTAVARIEVETPIPPTDGGEPPRTAHPPAARPARAPAHPPGHRPDPRRAGPGRVGVPTPPAPRRPGSGTPLPWRGAGLVRRRHGVSR